MKSKVILLILLFVLLFTGCGREAIDADASVDKPTTTAKATDEPDKPIKTKDPTESERITVHNANELVKAIAPGKHIYLEPGDYDLQKVRTETKYFNEHKSFVNLKDVTLEGVGNSQVDFFCDDIYASVLPFSNCQSITLINLNIGHTPTSDLGGSCEGMVLCFMEDCSDIRIDNCTMFGCGSIGLYANMTTDLTCVDSVIKDCSYTIMTLSEVSNIQFKNCRFEDNEATYIEVSYCEDVVFTDCLMSGYPDIPYFGSYKDMGFEVVFSQDTPGAVSSKEFEGITLKNVTFSIGEPSAAVKEELAQELAITEGLQREFPEAVECSVDITIDEYSGERLLDIYIELDQVPRDETLLEHAMQIMDVLSDYPLKMAFSFMLYDNERIYYFSYTNLRQAVEDYTKEPKGILRYATYISLNDSPFDYSTLFNNNISYIDAEQGKQIVSDRYSDFVAIYPELEPVTRTPAEVNYSATYYLLGRLYHMYYVTESAGNIYFNVAADDGSIIEYLAGDLYTVTKPDAELLRESLEVFIDDGFDIADDEVITVRQLGDNLLEFLTESHYYIYYTFEVKGGKYEFTRYVIEMGD